MTDAADPPSIAVSARASQILAQSRAHQPTVRQLLTELAGGIGGVLVGLEYEFKSQASLGRKLGKTMIDDGVTLDEAAVLVKDALRYTIQLDAWRYTGGVDRVLLTLVTRGYGVSVTNTWQRGVPYMGMNVTVRTSDGFRFEVQFHTPESLRVKELNHGEYEIQRELLCEEGEERARLNEVMIGRNVSVAIPVGVQQINDARYESIQADSADDDDR